MLDRIYQLLEPDVSVEAKLTALVLLLGRRIEAQQAEITDLQARQLQKGDRGEKGERGDQGVSGVPGAVGPAGRDGVDGKDGKPGKAGKDGKDGAEAPVIIGAEVDIDGHLVLEMSNGTYIDAGALPERAQQSAHNMMVSGNAWQVIISATEPTSPVEGQVWLDIS